MWMFFLPHLASPRTPHFSHFSSSDIVHSPAPKHLELLQKGCRRVEIIADYGRVPRFIHSLKRVQGQYMGNGGAIFSRWSLFPPHLFLLTLFITIDIDSQLRLFRRLSLWKRYQEAQPWNWILPSWTFPASLHIRNLHFFRQNKDILISIPCRSSDPGSSHPRNNLERCKEKSFFCRVRGTSIPDEWHHAAKQAPVCP